MKDKLKNIFEAYYIYNKEGELLPILKTDLGKELFGEVEVLVGAHKNGQTDAIEFLDDVPISQEDKENGMLLLNRLKNISIMQTDEWQVKRMLTLIEETGFKLHRKK